MKPNPQGTGLRAGRRLRYWFLRLRHNSPQKLMALLVATACWYFATEDRRATIQQRYQVEIEVRDNTRSTEKRAVSGLSPATVQVTLSGPRQRLAGVNANDIEAYIDVTDLPEGNFTHNIRVDGPDGTRSIKVTPASVQGQIDAQTSRRLPVTVSVSSAAPPASGAGNMTLYSSPHYQALPAQVTLSGPSRLVSSVAQVVTVPLEMQQGESRSASLVALDPQGVPVEVTLSPKTVTVSRQDNAAVAVHSVPVQLSAVPSGLRVSVSRIEPPRVRLLGAGVAGLTSVRAQVPYRAGTYRVQPELLLPAGVYSLDKVTVTLTVEER